MIALYLPLWILIILKTAHRWELEDEDYKQLLQVLLTILPRRPNFLVWIVYKWAKNKLGE